MAPSTSLGTKVQNPRDSMRSTWRKADRSQWSALHWFFKVVDMHIVDLDATAVPVHGKDDPMPYIAELTAHRWILTHAVLPVMVQQLHFAWTGYNLGPVATFVLYSAAFKLGAIRLMQALRGMGRQAGFLDGDAHARDDVPDNGIGRVFCSLLYSSLVRPLVTVMLSYRVTETPRGTGGWPFGWIMWLPVEIGLYGIVLDFWFYWYHRLMHDVGFLWRFHRTHHLTRHPSPLLTLYADGGQEAMDVAVIPVLAWSTMRLLGLPMGFYEWWFCHQYVLFTEIAGHSGLRILAFPPSTLTWLLRLVGCEIVIEDHDLHHRHGWRKSGNYGKQTRLWDVLFGTCKDRIETRLDNIDWDRAISMPWF